jgi:flagellar biosynthetic protein FliR
MAAIVAAPFFAARAGGALVDRARGGRDRSLETAIGLLALALFAAVGGPRLVVVGVAESYAALPVGAALDAQAGLRALVDAGGRIVVAGIAVAAPALAAMLLAELVMTAVVRAQPALAHAIGAGGVRTLVAVVVVGLSVVAAAQALGLGQIAGALEGAVKGLAAP